MREKSRVEKENVVGDIPAQVKPIIEKVINGCQEAYRRAHPTQGEILTRDCEETIKGYYRDQQGNSFLVLPIDEHLEICPTNSSRFRNWMATRYRRKYGSPPKSDAINQAKIQIEARCEDSPQVDMLAISSIG